MKIWILLWCVNVQHYVEYDSSCCWAQKLIVWINLQCLKIHQTKVRIVWRLRVKSFENHSVTVREEAFKFLKLILNPNLVEFFHHIIFQSSNYVLKVDKILFFGFDWWSVANWSIKWNKRESQKCQSDKNCEFWKRKKIMYWNQTETFWK